MRPKIIGAGRAANRTATSQGTTVSKIARVSNRATRTAATVNVTSAHLEMDPTVARGVTVAIAAAAPVPSTASAGTVAPAADLTSAADASADAATAKAAAEVAIDATVDTRVTHAVPNATVDAATNRVTTTTTANRAAATGGVPATEGNAEADGATLNIALTADGATDGAAVRTMTAAVSRAQVHGTATATTTNRGSEASELTISNGRADALSRTDNAITAAATITATHGSAISTDRVLDEAVTDSRRDADLVLKMTVAHEEGYSDDEPEDDFEVDGEVDDDYDFLDNDLFTSEVGQAASLPATASPLAPFDTPSAFNEQPVFSAPLLPVAPTEEQTIPIPPSGSVQVLQTSTTKLFEAMTASLGGRQSLRNIISSASSIPKTTKERHRTGKKDPFRIPVRYETLIPGGIAEAFARHRLSVGTVKVPFHGTKQLAENTLRFYQKHMRGIQYFCAIIGDYDSLLMLLEEPPTPVCPSMKPSTLASFIRFKRFPPGTLLVDADNNPVRDVFGNEITCQGGWNDPGSANGFLSVIGGIHRSRNQQGPYVSDCQRCYDYIRATRDDVEECSAHIRQPMLYRMGNPLNSSTVHDTLQNSTQAAATYTPNGDSGLTPWELLDIRRRLLSGNSLWELMIWVMILIGSKLFLRSAELLDLQFESNVDQNCLNWDLTVIQDGFIEGLCFKIKGKKDNQPIQLILWANHENPALCPVRHLLLYIHLSGLKSGYLFASAEFWKSSDRGHHCSHEDALSYGSFQQYFQHLCETVIKRDGKFGSHSIRKTGYVLAIWGGGNEAEIMHCARHKTYADAKKYKQDAAFLLELSRRSGENISSLVAAWHSNRNDYHRVPRANVRRLFDQDLHAAALYFFVELCNISLDNPHRSVIYCLDAAMRFKQPVSIDDEIARELQNVAPETARKLAALLQRAILQARSALRDTTVESNPERSVLGEKEAGKGQEVVPLSHGESSLQEAVRSLAPTIPIPVTSQEQSSSNSPTLAPPTGAYSSVAAAGMQPLERVPPLVGAVAAKKRKRGGTIDLPDRSSLSKVKTGIEKLKIIQAMYDQLPTDLSELADSVRVSLRNDIIPICKCLRNHFGGDMVQFLAKWGGGSRGNGGGSDFGASFAHSDFKRICCSGEGELCDREKRATKEKGKKRRVRSESPSQ